MSKRPQVNKDLRAMVLGDTIDNAVAGRVDDEGNVIPKGMPRWRWEMGKRLRNWRKINK